MKCISVVHHLLKPPPLLFDGCIITYQPYSTTHFYHDLELRGGI